MSHYDWMYESETYVGFAKSNREYIVRLSKEIQELKDSLPYCPEIAKKAVQEKIDDLTSRKREAEFKVLEYDRLAEVYKN